MRYVWTENGFVEKRSGKPMVKPYQGQICMPQVMSDIPEYRSPINGKPIGSRSARREDLKRNDCIEIDPPAKPRGYKNPSFAAKRGLSLREDVQ